MNAIAKGEIQQTVLRFGKTGFKSIYDTYLGECPKEFTYKGKTYTPRTFADEVLGSEHGRLCFTDFLLSSSVLHISSISKYKTTGVTHLSYNLPIDELMAVMDNAVNTGYTFAWGADVSEQGFTRDGIAVCPDAAEKGAELDRL